MTDPTDEKRPDAETWLNVIDARFPSRVEGSPASGRIFRRGG